jgi:hypothetical protein
MVEGRIEPKDTQEGDRGAHGGHGNSVAAWTCVSVIMLGSLLMCLAVALPTTWLFVVGAVVVVLGAISGKVLAAMGFGVSGRPGH